MSDSTITEIFASSLESLGFTKKRGVYLRPAGDVRHIAFLTKSRFGEQYYLDIGVLHPNVKGAHLKTPITWHLSTRAENLYGRVTGEIKSVLDAGDGANLMNMRDRKVQIERMLEVAERAFFGRFTSNQEVEAYVLKPDLPTVVFPIAMREYARRRESP